MFAADEISLLTRSQLLFRSNQRHKATKPAFSQEAIAAIAEVKVEKEALKLAID